MLIKKSFILPVLAPCLAVIMFLTALPARADAVTDWDIKAVEIITAAGLGAPPSNRVMAYAHTAAFDAANAITKQYSRPANPVEAKEGASVEAAIAAAYQTALTQLVPTQKAMIDAAYAAALATITDESARTAGVAVGQACAAVQLKRAAQDGAAARESYRPFTSAGQYVPTVVPVAPQWPQRKPWLMANASQFRPGAPPALNSERWARDYNEIKALGGKNSSARSTEQTDIAKFWEATGPSVYDGLVRSVANLPGRNLTQNARLFAAAAQAADDAIVAVFDAKYHYNFWRPITAIRNGDMDGNDATERDATWLPFIDTPMHPEYPCAHCIVSGAIGTVLQAELSKTSVPVVLTTASPTASGATRRWSNTEAFMQEVGNARVYDGVHYRFSAEIGTEMGRKIGALAVAKLMQ